MSLIHSSSTLTLPPPSTSLPLQPHPSTQPPPPPRPPPTLPGAAFLPRQFIYTFFSYLFLLTQASQQLPRFPIFLFSLFYSFVSSFPPLYSFLLLSHNLFILAFFPLFSFILYFTFFFSFFPPFPSFSFSPSLPYTSISLFVLSSVLSSSLFSSFFPSFLPFLLPLFPFFCYTVSSTCLFFLPLFLIILFFHPFSLPLHSFLLFTILLPLLFFLFSFSCSLVPSAN